MASEIHVNETFRAFVEEELLPEIDVEKDVFWRGVGDLIADLTPENRRLLKVRDELQELIDGYHRNSSGKPWDPQAYKSFLGDIGYLEESDAAFTIETANVDPEIASVAGPQLVVPVSNARFALNAANARWGSLYDALYGSDVISEEGGCSASGDYNPKRGERVIRYAAEFLDRAAPLAEGSHTDVTEYRIESGGTGPDLTVLLAGGAATALRDRAQFTGFRGEQNQRDILLKNNNLHIEIRIDPDHPVAQQSSAGVRDIVLESAVTTIQDCEDSVAAVDVYDKIGVYRNWLGLMRGDLAATFDKGGTSVTRELAADRTYTGTDGRPLVLPGRSLMLVRNVGHLMTSDAILDRDGEEVFEGILDAIITTGCALVDVLRRGRYRNTRTGSIYIVKPKMHGSAEVAFADKLFARVEDLYGLPRNTLKIGVMDEERRTTVNLAECIRAVRNRIVFINTGFLDRTGDEIHTSMLGGPMLPKDEIKNQPWITAYENRNVDVGIRCGLPGKAQIGKGMWPMPDEMKQMVETKGAHPLAGANCAWVPSPTAATLHAMHYHDINVALRQRELADRAQASLDDILAPPFGDAAELTFAAVQQELDNNVQGILGYVVRWIDLGIGCSKVPDIRDIGLMEDRATLRISSQHIANWLLHNVCTGTQVMDTLRRMANVVDRQNAGVANYQDMSANFADSVAFQAACDLIFKGREQPNGYTEPLLHGHRRRRKAIQGRR